MQTAISAVPVSASSERRADGGVLTQGEEKSKTLRRVPRHQSSPFLVLLSVLSVLFLAPLTSYAQAKYPFDLPAQPMAESLRAVGHQTSTNVMFEPRLVKGLDAPALRTETTPTEAIRLLLAGTKLTALQTAASTVLIQRVSTSEKSAPTSQAVAPTGTNGYTRLAQAETDLPPQGVRNDSQNAATGNSSPASADAERNRIALEEIVVTGTNIRGAGNSASPLIRLDREAIEKSGYSSTERLLRSIPQNFGGGAIFASSSVSAGEGSTNNFARGSGANLRGLGPSSTLVLLNNHRLAPVGLGDLVDVSLIPITAIDSMEIVTDGASAIYGSDAVAGVINIQLREEYAGAQTQLQYGAVTQGGLEEYQAGQLVGKSWGSGSALLSYQYDEQTELNVTERDFTRTVRVPTNLMPPNIRHSALLFASQDISDRARVSAEVLYNRRRSSDVNNSPGIPITVATEVEVYGATAGGVLDLRGDWQGDFTASYNRSNSFDKSSFAISGLPQPVTSTFDSEVGVRSFDAKADGSLFGMPGGSAKLAFGGHYRRETFLSRGSQSNSRGTDRRQVSALFSELLLPFAGEGNRRRGLERLELTLAGRYEDYDDFGSTTNSKLGLAWTPAPGLKLRGTYGTSFRAPLLLQLNEAARFFMNSRRVTDPAGGTTFVIVQDGNNSALQPEESKNWTVGVDFAPAGLASLETSLTYFNVEFTDRIATPLVGGETNVLLNQSINAAIITSNPSLATVNTLFAHPNFRNTANAQPNQIVAIVDNRLRNVARRRESGIDLSLAWRTETDLGSWGAQLSTAYLFEIENQLNAGLPSIDLVNGVLFPVDLRARGGIDWNRGGAGAALFVNYTDAYKDTRAGSVGPVRSWTTVDMTLSFDTGDGPGSALLKNLTSTLSMQNLLNKDPPFVADFLGFNYDAANANALGRFVSFQVRKQW